MRLLKVGDTVEIRRIGRFINKNGELYYDQPPHDTITISTEAELKRMLSICPKWVNPEVRSTKETSGGSCA